MTTLAKSRLNRYLSKRDKIRQNFVRKIRALTPEQKKEILVKAGVLTKKGQFTAHYR